MKCSKCGRMVEVGDNTTKCKCWVCCIAPFDKITVEREKKAELLLQRYRREAVRSILRP